jgi:ABC-type bacteriocin/lantibiotic exporter with double-glycine peptidase domain
VTTGYFQEDLQDTKYTCGPSSLQMALSGLGCSVSESQLSQWAGTTERGTTPEGMIRAVKRASEKCGIKLKALNPSFKSTGWRKVTEYIKGGCEVIIHLVTYPYLHLDYKGNVVWRNKYGHYVYLVGVNLQEGLVKIADPTKGIRTFRMEDMERSIAAVTWANSLYIICKG